MVARSDGPIAAPVLIAPTAAGKTELLLRVRERIAPGAGAAPFHVISVDSRQMYRGMAIGTAAPSPDELARVPHHLIATHAPDVPSDVASFVRDAAAAARAAIDAGAVPLFVAGTPFYLDALIGGLPATPPSDGAIRDALQREVAERGRDALYAELGRVDPTTAARIAPGDTYRIVRALEVWRLTGRPLSTFPRRTGAPALLPTVVVQLRRARPSLHARIAERVSAMIERGLPGEVARLREAGYDARSPGMTGIGYREFLAAGDPPWTDAQLRAVAAEISTATRRYARRQETFFRRVVADAAERSPVLTLDLDADSDRAVDALITLLTRP